MRVKNSKKTEFSGSDSSSDDSSTDSVDEMGLGPNTRLGLGKENCLGGEMIMMMHQKSIVKIEVTSKTYNHKQPWSSPIIDGGSGSGFVIRFGDKLCIATNAHVVSGAVEVSVRQAFGKKNYQTQIISVGHQCDCALVELPEALRDKVTPVDMTSGWLNVGERVYVMGFPQLGEEICITDGVVARREVDEYSHSGWYGLQYGVSAAINPGNSGGAAFNSDGRLVGVPFQGADNSQGFIIPVEILQHFIEDSLAGRRTAFPDLGLTWQPMMSRYLRQYKKMERKQSGVLVTKVAPLSSAKDVLKPGDVILQMDGNVVSNEGRVKVNGTWMDFEYLLTRKYVGESMHLSVLREGDCVDCVVPLQHTVEDYQLVKWQHDEQPTFVILSGIVYKVLAENDISALDDDEDKSVWGSQLIVLHRVLSHKSTKGYEDYQDEAIVMINGSKIHNMNEVIKAISQSNEDYIVIKVKSGQEIVVGNIKKNANAKAYHQQILSQYDITTMCSRDLKPLLEQSGLCDLKQDELTVKTEVALVFDSQGCGEKTNEADIVSAELSVRDTIKCKQEVGPPSLWGGRLRKRQREHRSDNLEERYGSQ